MKYYLAIDLGASSGRHIVGYKNENGELILDEVHRFLTGMNECKDGLVWNIPLLFEEIVNGIKAAIDKYGKIESLAIDTWGVDYVLINNDQDVAPYYAYRNNRVEKRIDEVHKIIPFNELYSRTGIQFAYFNTIYQLFDDLKAGRLENATDFLMLPQYFAYRLTGVKKHEYTEASTSGLVNAKTKEFDMEIIDKLGLPRKLFPKLSKPGETVGFLKEEIANKVGGQIKVILAPSHDTACAFESVDSPKDAAFLSSGTWSLLGYKLDNACASEKSLQYNFTNEGGVGYIRFLKNIMGMWVPNQFQKDVGLSIQEMVKLANESNYNEYFDVNDSSLAAPKSMKEAILNLLKGRKPKETKDLVRSIYISLAHSYDKAIKELEECLNIKINYLYIVGGGAKNQLLNQLTEQITGVKVVALPIEATAIGNIKTQIKIDE